MDLFLKANQLLSSDLRYLSYYKIFEYFAPLYSRLEAFESMRNKIDSANAKLPTGDFIASIFELAKNYDNSLRDSELIKSLINNTFDFIDLYLDLPLSIRKKLKMIDINYKSKKENIERIINELGNILYHTRNGIVHAKSNYIPTGLECKNEDLDTLNEFMHKACYGTIKWYNRLPKHLKIT